MQSVAISDSFLCHDYSEIAVSPRALGGSCQNRTSGSSENAGGGGVVGPTLCEIALGLGAITYVLSTFLAHLKKQ
jgi:hypothetical protein